MKHWLAILIGSVFCLSGFPSVAEAKSHDDWHYKKSFHEDHHDSKKHRHHRRHLVRVYQRAHFEWHHGHRDWVPGHWVTTFV